MVGCTPAQSLAELLESLATDYPIRPLGPWQQTTASKCVVAPVLREIAASGRAGVRVRHRGLSAGPRAVGVHLALGTKPDPEEER